VNNFLFIGYDHALHNEIREFLKERQGSVYFTTFAIETIRLLDKIDIDYVVLNMHRIEDAGILRYININFRKVKVLIIPGEAMKEAIPALTEGNYKVLNNPFTLNDLIPFV
jgi:DNA-binding NtrC family response regulator